MAEIDRRLWGTPANFNGFRDLTSLLHWSMEVNQTLHDVWPSPGLVHHMYIFGPLLPGAKIFVISSTSFNRGRHPTYICLGGHLVGHRPTFFICSEMCDLMIEYHECEFFSLWYFYECCCFVCLSTASLVKNQQWKDNILLWLTTQHGLLILWMARRTLSIRNQILTTVPYDCFTVGFLCAVDCFLLEFVVLTGK